MQLRKALIASVQSKCSDSLSVKVQQVMPHCADAAFVAMIRPTAGFLPDTVFDLGVDSVGFFHVKDLDLFLERFANGGKWGEATSKIWAMPPG